MQELLLDAVQLYCNQSITGALLWNIWCLILPLTLHRYRPLWIDTMRKFLCQPSTQSVRLLVDFVWFSSIARALRSLLTWGEGSFHCVVLTMYAFRSVDAHTLTVSLRWMGNSWTCRTLWLILFTHRLPSFTGWMQLELAWAMMNRLRWASKKIFALAREHPVRLLCWTTELLTTCCFCFSLVEEVNNGGSSADEFSRQRPHFAMALLGWH